MKLFASLVSIAFICLAFTTFAEGQPDKPGGFGQPTVSVLIPSIPVSGTVNGTGAVVTGQTAPTTITIQPVLVNDKKTTNSVVLAPPFKLFLGSMDNPSPIGQAGGYSTLGLAEWAASFQANLNKAAVMIHDSNGVMIETVQPVVLAPANGQQSGMFGTSSACQGASACAGSSGCSGATSKTRTRLFFKRRQAAGCS